MTQDHQVAVGGEDALSATLIAMAAKKSLEENRPVDVEEIRQEAGLAI